MPARQPRAARASFLVLGLLAGAACEAPATLATGPTPGAAPASARMALRAADGQDTLLALPENDPVPAGMEDAVALSFDDGIDDGGRTDAVLDVLARRGVHATFFINSDNDADGAALADSAAEQATVRRIYADGHLLGNHTAHHADLGRASSPTVAWEIDRVEQVVRDAMNRPDLRLTLVRAPYGRPLSPTSQRTEPDNYARVAALVAARGVHVAWNIDPDDWAEKSVDQVVHDTLQPLDGGARGIILMHAIGAHTAAALPAILDGIASRGLRVVTVEDIVRAKYGATSDLLMGAPPPPGPR